MSNAGASAAPAIPFGIRPARAQDVDWIAASWARVDIEGAVRGGRRSVWLAEDGAGGRLGFLVAEDCVDRVEIHAVAVAGLARRRGVGRALVRRAVERARASRRERVDLEVGQHNRAARALYVDEGFIAVARRPRYYRGGEDALLMSLRVTSASPATARGHAPAARGRE